MTRKKSTKELFEQCLSDTSIHGFRYTVDRQFKSLRKSFVDFLDVWIPFNGNIFSSCEYLSGISVSKSNEIEQL